jgi:hypothetical protein
VNGGNNTNYGVVQSYDTETGTAAGTASNVNATQFANPTANSAASYTNVNSWSDTASSAVNYTGGFYGLQSQFQHNGSGTVAVAIGEQNGIYNASTGIITTGIGGQFMVQNQSSGSITSATGVAVGPVQGSASGAAYGVYVNGVSGATTNYDLYANDSGASNYMAGYLGIGTTTPNNPLVIEKDQATWTRIVNRNTNSNGGVGFNFGTDQDPNYAAYIVMTGSTYPALSGSSTLNIYNSEGATTLWTGAAERMRVTSGGSVGIATTSPSYPLDVTGDIRTTTCLHYASSTLGTCSSDARLKKDVRPFDLGLNVILGLKPKYFKYNGLGGEQESTTDQMGFIAHDVEKVAPDLVSTRQVKLHPEDKMDTTIKVVNYSAFIYTVINAIKSMYAEFSETKAEVTALKTENEKLKQENLAIKAYLCAKDPGASICH